VLSLSKMAAGQERYYLDLGREDYYLDGGEPPGYWLGRAARELGLTGTVHENELRALIAGRDPQTAEPLGRSIAYDDGRHRQVGWDLTFSAPKSVSVLWSQASDALRSSLEQAHREAVKAAIAYLEEEAAAVRTGKGGRLQERAQLAVAAFDHGTSRAQDPALHTHCLVMAAARRMDGTWGQLHSRPLYEHKMAAGALYRLEFARGLRHLGLDLRSERSWFEIEGVPPKVSESFSKRRAEIEEKLSELGVAGAAASEQAALSTRHVKQHAARAELFERWRREGVSLGFGPAEAAKLFGVERVVPAKLDAPLVVEAVKELTDTDSSFTERALVQHVAGKLQASAVRAVDLVAAVRTFLQTSKEVVRLGSMQDGSGVYTEAALHRAEETLLATAEKLHDRQGHAVSDRIVKKLTPGLSEEQRAALEHLTAAGDLKLLSGVTGSGKNYTLEAARAAWERAGFNVYGTALWGRAAIELQDSTGIKSSTVKSLLYHLDPTLKRTLSHFARMMLRACQGKSTWRPFRLDSNSVLVIDAAEVVGTRHLSRLLRIAQRSGAKVVLSGDTGQLQSIDPGGGLKALLERYKGASLTNIVRQENKWMRLAVEQFAEGDPTSALSNFALADRLHVERNRSDAMRSLILAWRKERTKDLSQTLILAGTNRETDELNRLVQDARWQERGAALSHKGRTFYEGDRVQFSVARRALGVSTGDLGTVETINGGRLCVLLDRKALAGDEFKDVRVILRAKDLEVRSFGRTQDLLRLAYATTVHNAKGATVDRTFVLAGGWMQDRELSCVQMSRARNHCRVFTDEASAGEDLAELVKAMSRSEQKVLAHDVLASLTLRQQ
jgi:conjugative relaxase-like TrwC/TraI family protein